MSRSKCCILTWAIVECIGDFLYDSDRVVNGQPRLPVEPIAQRFPFHERHHVVQHAVRFAGVVQRQNVRMLQIGRGADLGEEPLGAERNLP